MVLRLFRNRTIHKKYKQFTLLVGHQKANLAILAIAMFHRDSSRKFFTFYLYSITAQLVTPAPNLLHELYFCYQRILGLRIALGSTRYKHSIIPHTYIRETTTNI
jgi:hypothetical protein